VAANVPAEVSPPFAAPKAVGVRSTATAPAPHASQVSTTVTWTTAPVAVLVTAIFLPQAAGMKEGASAAIMSVSWGWSPQLEYVG